MRKGLKPIGACLLVALVAGLAQGTSTLHSLPLPAVQLSAALPPSLDEHLRSVEEAGDSVVEMSLAVGSPTEVDPLKQVVREAGGEIIMEEGTHFQVRLPVASAKEVAQATPVMAVGVDGKVAVDPPASPALNSAVELSRANELVSINMDAVGVPAFRNEHSVDGKGVVIAVIDSGVDAGHAGLLQTSDGRPKIVDWKDFTSEGRVLTPYPVEWGSSFTAPGGRSYVLPRDAAAGAARFGFWDESRVSGAINKDVNRNGSQVDRLGVLLLQPVGQDTYRTVYVDSDNDGSFADEQPLRVYRESRSAVRFGRFSTDFLNVVVADIDPQGTWVTFGFDGLGHGTQVSGVLAGYLAGQHHGVAPGAQLMALKAVKSNAEGNWFEIKSAIHYAATHGASVINVSLGGLSTAARVDSTASDWLSQIARQYGVLIVFAADNTGPGLSSGTTLGSSAQVMAVGAYYSPAMWQRDHRFVVPSEGVWWSSGMGPRLDGSYVPNLVAPGGSPTLSPQWLHATGYTTAQGTSMAAPHVTGAAALLIEAGKRQGIQYDYLSLKRAMEMGARPLAGISSFEQGHGVLQLQAAWNKLQQVNSVPTLHAVSREGHGGLLARSYRPGSGEFLLTNSGPDLTRVNLTSSHPWVVPALSTLTLPPGVSRSLPVHLRPPDELGVHSAFIQVSQPDRFGESLTIPVTYVRPVALDMLSDQRYASSDLLEVARFRRTFFSVKPGTSSFTVGVRVLPGPQNKAQGTLKVQVFRPDGQVVYASDPIGVQGSGLTASFRTDFPMEGAWEVVVTALPDTTGENLNAGYSMEVQAQPGHVVRHPLQFAVPAGSTTKHSVELVNPGATFTGRAVAVGLTRQDQSTPWRVIQKPNMLVDDFTISEFSTRMRLEIANPLNQGVDLSLRLYRQDPVEGWKMIRQSVTPGTSREIIELENQPPGRYQLSLGYEAGGMVPGAYQYRRLVGLEGFHLSVSDTARRRIRGERWTAELTIDAPATPGKYTGYLLIRDTENGTDLGWYPIQVSVGLPALELQRKVSQLKWGSPSQVVMELRNTATGQLVDGALTVNGQSYYARSGRVAIPVTPYAEAYDLTVASDLAGYQPLRATFRLPVQQVWGTHPIGVGPTQENSVWRRKVTTQLP